MVSQSILVRFSTDLYVPMTRRLWSKEKTLQEIRTKSKRLISITFFIYQRLAFAVELALAKAQEKDSVFRIRSAADAYEALTNKEILEMVLQQGLKDEHKRYKDRIVELFTSIKDIIKVEDLRIY